VLQEARCPGDSSTTADATFVRAALIGGGTREGEADAIERTLVEDPICATPTSTGGIRSLMRGNVSVHAEHAARRVGSASATDSGDPEQTERVEDAARPERTCSPSPSERQSRSRSAVNVRYQRSSPQPQ
jgi:hypothetical protein